VPRRLIFCNTPNKSAVLPAVKKIAFAKQASAIVATLQRPLRRPNVI
jgi:hypothetical protein